MLDWILADSVFSVVINRQKKQLTMPVIAVTIYLWSFNREGERKLKVLMLLQVANK